MDNALGKHGIKVERATTAHRIVFSLRFSKTIFGLIWVSIFILIPNASGPLPNIATHIQEPV